MLFRLMITVFAAVIVSASAASAITFTNLHNFTALISYPGPNEDGAQPHGGLVSSGGTLFGTAADGGGYGNGTVFAINADGTSFTNLHSFSNSPAPVYEGTGPSAALAVSGNSLYGTARGGGTNGLGTVFTLSTSGSNFFKIHDFGSRLGTDPLTGNNTNSGGAFPETDLVYSNGTLYGATVQGGSGGNGPIFKINTDGGGFTILHNFTNADGGYPSTHMVLIGTNLFGTTVYGGNGSGTGYGTVFRVNTDGTGFTNLYKFDDAFNNPEAGLVMAGNTLYGTTSGGSAGAVLGDSGSGSVFKINPDGTSFTNFFYLNSNLIYDPNATATAWTGLAINGSTIYADAVGYDAYGYTVFSVNTDGTGYTKLTSFNNPGDPGQMTGVTFAGGNLYCTAWNGGAYNNGTVFALILSPAPVPLSLKLSGNSLILSWSSPTLSLYSAPALNAEFTPISGATSPYTNTITGTQKYYELK